MRNLKTLLVVLVLSLAISASSNSADSIYVSQIKGLDPAGGLMTNTPIKFYIHYEVDSISIIAIANGFSIYSPDAATWQPIFAETLFDLYPYFHGSMQILEWGITGESADTVELWGFDSNFPSVGFGSYFNEEVFYIETQLTDDQIGKTLCIDTVHGDGFIWAFPSGFGVEPGWQGEQCFEIVDCCAGIRGDVNGDGVGPNIVDLVGIVNYVFRESAPPLCALESDVNSDGVPYNTLDLVFLVNYFHRGGPPPGACP